MQILCLLRIPFQLFSFDQNYKLFLTRILGSVKLVHIAISSRVLISGYLFRVKSASSSCNCWDVKWVRCLRLPLAFVLLLFPLFLLLIGLVSALILVVRILWTSSLVSTLSICPWLVLVSGGLSGLLWLLGAVSWLLPKWCWCRWKPPGSEKDDKLASQAENRLTPSLINLEKYH